MPAFRATASFLIVRSTLIQTPSVLTLTCRSENMTHLSTFSHRFPFGLSGSVAKFRMIAAGSAVVKAALHRMLSTDQTRRPFAGRIKHLNGDERVDRIPLILLAGAPAVTHGQRETSMPATPSAAQCSIPDLVRA